MSDTPVALRAFPDSLRSRSLGAWVGGSGGRKNYISAGHTLLGRDQRRAPRARRRRSSRPAATTSGESTQGPRGGTLESETSTPCDARLAIETNRSTTSRTTSLFQLPVLARAPALGPRVRARSQVLVHGRDREGRRLFATAQPEERSLPRARRRSLEVEYLDGPRLVERDARGGLARLQRGGLEADSLGSRLLPLLVRPTTRWAPIADQSPAGSDAGPSCSPTTRYEFHVDSDAGCAQPLLLLSTCVDSSDSSPPGGSRRATSFARSRCAPTHEAPRAPSMNRRDGV